MRQTLQLHSFLTTVALAFGAWSQADAYNQGSYLFFNLQPAPEAPSIAGRIDVPQDFFASTESASTNDSREATAGSDFEIDYQTFGSDSKSPFDSDPIDFGTSDFSDSIRTDGADDRTDDTQKQFSF